MHYTEFRKAAERHMIACEYMLAQLDKASNTDKDKILKDVYYLSGYVIECMFKYVHFAFDDTWVHTDDVNMVLNQRGIKNHKIENLYIRISSHILNIPLQLWPSIGTSLSTTHENLRQKWTEGGRYEIPAGVSINSADISSYIDLVRQCYETLKNAASQKEQQKTSQQITTNP